MAKDPRRKGRPRRPSRQFREAIRAEAAKDTHEFGTCLLCGEPPQMVGFWIPTKRFSRTFGFSATKTGVVLYSLCQRCAERPDSIPSVEERLLEERMREQVLGV